MKIMGIVAALALLLAGSAAAQQKNMQQYGETDAEKTQAEVTREKEAERAYKRSLGNIPEQKNSDPWGTVRSDSAAPKAAAKAPAKPKATKTDTRSETTAKQ